MDLHHHSGNYMEHGFCFAWEPALVWLHVASDILIGIAYYSIPVAMLYIMLKRRDLPFYRMMFLFPAFILSCGTTHFFAAYTVFRPDYWPEGWVKAFTALASICSAVFFIPAIPKFLALPSLAAALEEIQSLNATLETRVQERTAALNMSREELKRQNDELSRIYRKLEQETAERVQAMEDLRKRDQLLMQQSRLATMGEMLNNIAHQWRQPLNVLGLNIQHLALSAEQEGFNKELLDQSTRDSMEVIQHMSHTIDDFRSFFKPDGEKSNFGINQAIQQSVALVTDSFRYHQIETAMHLGEEAVIHGYHNEFSQAILNILQNARDALVERQVRGGLVTIVSSLRDGARVITVSDNAGGITEENTDSIFEPYFSTKGLNGTGIGLYMAKNIIENNMGGRLTVRNIPGGAEFAITLPL